MPDPSPFGYAEDIDAILQSARNGWLPITTVTGYIEEWSQRAQGNRWCVHALIGFLRTCPVSQQADPGLGWVRRLVVADDGSARTSGFLLLDWLTQLRDSHALGPASWSHYRPAVDALALRGSSGARDLQRRDE